MSLIKDITEIRQAAIELSRTGKPLQALTIYEKALEKFPDNLEILNHLAITYIDLQRYQQAIDVYQRMLELNPDDSGRLLGLLGNVHCDLRQYDRAIAFYHRSLEIKPNSELNLHKLGLAYYCHSDSENAIKYIKKAHVLNDKSFNVIVDLAAIYRNLNQEAEFRFYLEEARKIKHLGFEDYGQACFAAIEDDLKTAIELLEKDLKIFSKYTCKSAPVEPAFERIKETEEFIELIKKHCSQ